MHGTRSDKPIDVKNAHKARTYSYYLASDSYDNDKRILRWVSCKSLYRKQATFHLNVLQKGAKV